MEITTIYILIILFFATLVRSTFGFGESLVAVPLLLFFVPKEVAVPLAVLVSISVAGVVVAQDHKKIQFKSARWLILFGLLGTPIGIYILTYGNDLMIKIGLSFLIIAYSIYSLFGKQTKKLATDNMIWLFICGFLSGVFGGIYGVNGPPLVLYGNMKNWTAKDFRATLQAYFLPVSCIGMFGYWYQGLWSEAVTHYFLISIPVIIPTIFLGRYLNHKLNNDTFFKYVYFGLIILGLILLFESVL